MCEPAWVCGQSCTMAAAGSGRDGSAEAESCVGRAGRGQGSGSTRCLLHTPGCALIGLSREPWGTVPERSSGRLEAGAPPTWVPAPAPPPPHHRGIGLSKGPGGPTAPWPPRQLPCSPPITPQLAPTPPRGPLPSAEPCRGWAAGIGVIHGSPSPSCLLPASGRRRQAPGPGEDDSEQDETSLGELCPALLLLRTRPEKVCFRKGGDR